MKKALSALLATSMMLGMAIPAFAAAPTSGRSTLQAAITPAAAYDEDGVAIKGFTGSTGKAVLDPVLPNSTVYIQLPEFITGTVGGDADIKLVTSDFADKKLFSVKYNKTTGSNLVKSVTVESEKKLNNVAGRHAWVKIILNDTTATDEKQFKGSITFKAKKTMTKSGKEYAAAADKILSGDSARLDLHLWVSNQKVSGSDATADTGDRIYYEPAKNDTNTITWGDDRAAVKFDSSDGKSKFYARLSTKSNSDIYAQYGDSVNADLWFYDFVGNPTVPATSRATLTLGIPWDKSSDKNDNISPENCYIYQLDKDNNLTDVTDKFKFSEDAQDIEGWSTRTRTLGSYVISDTKLKLKSVDNSSDDKKDNKKPAKNPTASSKPNNDKKIPNTGSSDMVNVAVATAVVSLIAAGAVAFKKVSK